MSGSHYLEEESDRHAGPCPQCQDRLALSKRDLAAQVDALTAERDGIASQRDSAECDRAMLARIIRDVHEHAAREGTNSKAWQGLHEITRPEGIGDALGAAMRWERRHHDNTLSGTVVAARQRAEQAEAEVEALTVERDEAISERDEAWAEATDAKARRDALASRITNAEAEVERLREVVARVEELADQWRIVDDANSVYAERIGERSRFAEGIAARADMLRAALAGPTGQEGVVTINSSMRIADEIEVEEALILAFDEAMQDGSLDEGDRITLASVAQRGLFRAGLLITRPDQTGQEADRG